MKFIHSKKGFTLVELLIVISIIAILTGIIITGLTSSRAKSRDAQRVSNLSQIQLALEQYFDRCGQYPVAITDTSATNGCPSDITFGSYISVIPKDPSTNANYDYLTNVSGSNVIPTDYILHTTLENSNAAQQNSFSDDSLSVFITNVTQPSWDCYDATNFVNEYCVSTK